MILVDSIQNPCSCSCCGGAIPPHLTSRQNLAQAFISDSDPPVAVSSLKSFRFVSAGVESQRLGFVSLSGVSDALRPCRLVSLPPTHAAHHCTNSNSAIVFQGHPSKQFFTYFSSYKAMTWRETHTNSKRISTTSLAQRKVANLYSIPESQTTTNQDPMESSGLRRKDTTKGPPLRILSLG